ncbi:MAG: VanZ family protein [Planctomycetota bacterium]
MVWMGVLWWLTAQPSRDLPVAPEYPVLMNGGHVVAFGILAALLFLAGDGDLRRRCLWAVVLTAAYGVATELNQAFGTSGRIGDPWDVAADAVGGVMFACALVWVRSGSARALWLALAMLPLALLITVMAS